jgi:hypothetical protein
MTRLRHHPLRHSGQAHGFVNRLGSGSVSRVVARKIAAKAAESEATGVSDWARREYFKMFEDHAQLQPDDSRIATVSVTVLSSVLAISMVPIWADATP